MKQVTGRGCAQCWQERVCVQCVCNAVVPSSMPCVHPSPWHRGEERRGERVPSLCPRQELTRREVVDVTHLEIPAELMGLLEAAAGEWGRQGSPLNRPCPYPWGAGCRSCRLCRSRPGGERQLRGPGAAPGAAARLPAHPPARHQRLPHGQVRAGPLPGKGGTGSHRWVPTPVRSGFAGFLSALDAVERFGFWGPCMSFSGATGRERGRLRGGCGAAWGWRRPPARPPSPWVPVVSRGRGDPAEVIAERSAEPCWTPDVGQIRNPRGREIRSLCSRAPSPGPGCFAPFLLFLLFLLSPLCVSKSPGSPTAALGLDPAPSLSLIHI